MKAYVIEAFELYGEGPSLQGPAFTSLRRAEAWLDGENRHHHLYSYSIVAYPLNDAEADVERIEWSRERGLGPKPPPPEDRSWLVPMSEWKRP